MENHNSELVMEQLRKELRITRIFCAISSLLTVCLLAGGFLLFNSMEPVFVFLNEAKPVMEQMAALDVEEVNATLEQVNTTLGSVDWEQMTETLGELDVEAINTAIEGLDTKELSEAIENMNDAAEVLERWGEKWNSFFKG